MADQHTFEGWVILEIMGHRRLGGYLTEQELAGASFIRIDIPDSEAGPAVTQFYRPEAVYAITPTTEDVARAVALRNRPSPVQRWELPAPKQDTRCSACGEESLERHATDEFVGVMCRRCGWERGEE